MNLPVTQGHLLHYAAFGNPTGIPLLFVHGGPGSGCNPAQAKLLHPDGFRIIQFDQRGCGRSTPSGRLLGNRTAALLRDMEALRQHLGIQQWAIYGGSWGATLALEYAKHYPQRVLGLLLRGVFLARQEDWEWFSLPQGVAQHLPAAYQALLEHLAPRRGENPINSLYRHLLNPRTSPDTAHHYALAWDAWEAAVMGLPTPVADADAAQWQTRIHRARVYSHYCVNQFFLPPAGVLPNLTALQHLPISVVHGVKDQVCRFASAHALSNALPHTQWCAVEAGHGMHEPAMQNAVQQAASALYTTLLYLTAPRLEHF
jgi:proline iminopeptidase